MDLHGPMPSNKHAVVVQDLGSRFPAAKLVTSTKGDKVIPVLADIYDTFGNPCTQISDNGPPFNSRKMADFAEGRDIVLQFSAPCHPSINPVETCMRPSGKAMKIGKQNGQSEEESLGKMLNTYRHTPHTITALASSSVLFRDGQKGAFPRKPVSDADIDAAKARDSAKKSENETKVNSSKYRKEGCFSPGDVVIIRNRDKKKKIDPLFNAVFYKVIVVDKQAGKIILEGSEGLQLTRHPDDVKPADLCDKRALDYQQLTKADLVLQEPVRFEDSEEEDKGGHSYLDATDNASYFDTTDNANNQEYNMQNAECKLF